MVVEYPSSVHKRIEMRDCIKEASRQIQFAQILHVEFTEHENQYFRRALLELQVALDEVFKEP